MATVTGLGGVFYKVPDVERTRAWYRDTLGLGSEWGIMFPWPEGPREDPLSLLTAFEEATDYLAPSTKPFMINLRVDDLDAMVAQLEASGVEILGRQDDDDGRFAWILDCDGIKLELWQQKPSAGDARGGNAAVSPTEQNGPAEPPGQGTGTVHNVSDLSNVRAHRS